MTESSESQEKDRNGSMNRRDFIKLSALVVAGAGLAAACQPEELQHPGITAPPVPVKEDYPEVPVAPPQPPPAQPVALTPDEAEEVVALTARIYPGNADDPGAREAGVMNYIDKMLAFHDGFVEPTYTHGPHAKGYEGDQPPDQKSDELGEIIWVKKSELERYGYQSILKPLQRYRNGLASVNAYTLAQYGALFVDLSEQQQDEVLAAMEKGNAADYFKDPSDKQFFKMLQEDTIQGMFSDPAYGGNRDMVGWKQIGYPGAQRAYTPEEMNTEGPPRPPQSLAMLHAFHAGMNANPNVILPQSGSRQMPH